MKNRMNNKSLSLRIITGTFIILLLAFVLIFLSKSFSKDSTEDFKENYKETITRPLLNLEKSNGIVTNIWLENEEQLEKFTQEDIKYLFVDVGGLDSQGKITTPENEITNFLSLIKNFEGKKGHDFVVLPYTEIIINKDYSLDSGIFTDNLVKEHSRLVDLGFDGVHIDVEAVPFSQRDEYLEFLEKLDKSIGNEKLITVYAGSYNENPNIWEWEPEFYRNVANRVDLITIPGYDFGLEDEEQYKNYVKNQIEFIENKEWNSKFMFAIPTHKKEPETIDNALDAFSDIKLSETESRFIGIAIFAEWTTDEKEWEIFENYLKDARKI